MKTVLLRVSLLFCAATLAVAEPEPSSPLYDADTLRLFLSKSTVVVVATVKEFGGFVGVNSAPIYKPGVVQVEAQDRFMALSVERTLYGAAPQEQELAVEYYRFSAQNGTSDIPLPKEGQRYIVFLKLDPYGGHTVNGRLLRWNTADVWFGVIPFDTALAMRIEEMPLMSIEKKPDFQAWKPPRWSWESAK